MIIVRPTRLCRICVVEVAGARVLAASCVAQVSEGMVVNTRTERVNMPAARSWRCSPQRLTCRNRPKSGISCRNTSADPAVSRTPNGAKHPVIDDNPMYIRDYAKCILCWRCVQVCAEDAQYTFAINFSGRGYETQIGTFFDKPMPETTCVFCGQCVGVCPTGALKSKRMWLLEQGYTPDEIMDMTRTERKRRMRRETASTQVQENRRRVMIQSEKVVSTTCPYCGVGCNLQLHIKDDFIFNVTTPFDGWSIKGNLCVKGRFGYDFIYQQETYYIAFDPKNTSETR
jgi:predicted molibdopterin-dependent oxidoreductase YjgC